MNKVILLGNLTHDPVLRVTGVGKSVCTIRIAVNNRKGDPLYIDVVTWEGLADNCEKYLSKGRKVLVEGQLKINQWKDKEGNDKSKPEVNAFSVEFLGGDMERGNDDRHEPEIPTPEWVDEKEVNGAFDKHLDDLNADTPLSGDDDVPF